MGEQHRLDFRTGYVVPGRDYHVVGAGLISEVAIGVLDIGVAGDVPAALHVLRLPAVAEVAAAGRAAHREPPGGSGRHLAAGPVNDARFVSRNRPAGRAGAHVLLAGSDKDMQHLGRTQAVDDPDSRRCLPRLECGCRKRLAGRNAFPQRRNVMLGEFAEHIAIGRRSGETDRRAELFDGRKKIARRRLFQQNGGRAYTQRKQHEAPQSEGKRDRGEPMKRSFGAARSTYLPNVSQIASMSR